ILANEGVEIVQVEEVDVDSYEDFEAHEFEADKNIIGYDWKSYDMENGSYVVADSTMYFVQDKAGSIWKLVLTGFGGSATSDYQFTKQLLEATTIEEAGTVIATLVTYPNPVVNGQLNIAYNLKAATTANLSIVSLSGQTLLKTSTSAHVGLNSQSINTNGWAAGIYFVQLEIEGKATTQKVIVH